MGDNNLEFIFSEFSVNENFEDAIPFGSGHINDTYLVSTKNKKYILQKVNHRIFKDVEKMNQNIIKALDHINRSQENHEEARFRKLEIYLSGR